MKNKNQKKSFLKRLFSKKAAASVGTAVKVLTSVVLGAAMLAGTYGVVKTGVIPTTEAKVSSMYEVTDVVTTGGSVSDDIQVQYEMLDGAGQTYTTGQATPLSFRSSAPMSTFKGVKVDDVTVDSSNYTVTEGSTIVTFTPEYSEALSEGEHTVAILSEGGSATATFTAAANSLVHSGTIPEGATYKQGSTTYTAGQSFPTIANGDIYTYGDYKYTYKTKVNGYATALNAWRVSINTNVINKNQVSYGPILESINVVPVKDISYLFGGCSSLNTAPVIPNEVIYMQNAFAGCSSLVIAPAIPNKVKNMDSTFTGCSALTTVPEIPSSVTTMKETFENCSALTTAPVICDGIEVLNLTFTGCSALTSVPVIPGSVNSMYSTFVGCTALVTTPTLPDSVCNMYNVFANCTSLTTVSNLPNNISNLQSTFRNCTSLTGTIEINSNPIVYNECFTGTEKPITLTGSSTKLADLAATANNGNVTY